MTAIVLFLIIILPIFSFLIYTCINETVVYTYMISYAIFSPRDYSIGRTVTERRGFKNRRLSPRDFILLEEELRIDNNASKLVTLNVIRLKPCYRSRTKSNGRMPIQQKMPKNGPKLMK